ncbi:MAG: Alternative RNA polymerase sigma factor SigE, partial [uncultured Friedmanniella sp.]
GAVARPRPGAVAPARRRDLRGRRRGARLDAAHLGGGRPRPQRPGVPPGLPADRQRPRRRGPHAGRLRPRLPLAAPLPARHVRGLAAPHHHQPLPGRRPTPAEDPLRRHGRRLGGAAAQQLAHPVGAARRRRPGPRRRRRPGRAVAGVPGRRRALRHRGPQLRGDQRGPRRQDRHRAQPHPPRALAAAGRPRPPPPHRGERPLPRCRGGTGRGRATPRRAPRAGTGARRV